MSFANQKNILIYDSLGNLHNFRWDKEEIYYIKFNRDESKFDTSSLIKDSTLEFDVALDKDDHIYLVYQKKDNNMVLMKLVDDSWSKNDLGSEGLGPIFNLNIITHHDGIHIFYCIPSNENNRVYRIYHHFYDEQWHTWQIGDIARKNLLNPFQLVKTEEKIFIAFYNVVNGGEQIFINEFNLENNLWKGPVQLTSSIEDKLYLDILMPDSETIHLTYSQYFDGNLIVKHEKYKMKGNKMIKILENILSNPSNCSYPTLIMEKDKLWNIWTEYDQVFSSYTTDGGLTWSFPYQWKESKEGIFFRYKFYANDGRINNFYQLNYTFGKDYPKYSFIGFGSLEKAQEVPLKENIKKKDRDESRREGERVMDDFENKNNKIDKEELEILKERIKKLEERMDYIESYFKRRRPLFSPKK